MGLHGAAVLVAFYAACLLGIGPALAAGDGQPFVAVPLERTAVGATSDPLGVWTPAEMGEDPRGSDLYAGALRRGTETVVVSQRVSSACGSPSDCPVRVVVAAADGTRRVLLRQEQACAASTHFAVRADLSALEACDRILPMGPQPGAGTPPGASAPAEAPQ